MTIKSRFFIFTAAIILLTGLFSWLSMKVLAEEIITKWVEIYAEKQLRYDKVRNLLPLIQEVKLSKEFAELDSLKAWALQPDNENLKQQALLDTEAFRHHFADNSYFIALQKNNRYYYSDSDSKELSKDFYRYTLDENKAEDAWFYSIMEKQLDLHLNVNPDLELGVVKLWSDVLIRVDGEVIGVVGTGLDLSEFLGRMVAKQDIYSAVIFTNYEGSIQLHQKEELINFSSVTKQLKDKKTVFQLLDDADSKLRLYSSFENARSTPNTVDMSIVYKEGNRLLASVIYIPEIDWFQVNFIDINRFLPWTEFSGLLIVFLISLISALIIFYFLVRVIITQPLEDLDASISTLEENNYRPPKLHRFSGLEVKRLISHFQTMSETILDYQTGLEKKVAERTQELNILSTLDPLTNLYNRRGFEEHLTNALKQWHESQQSFSLVSVDVDEFKQVNDQYGHAMGDQLLVALAEYLQSTVINHGEAARWGGDEFLLLIKDCELENTEAVLKRLLKDRESFRVQLGEQEVHISFSVGCARIEEQDTLENLLSRADKAMYQEKKDRH